MKPVTSVERIEARRAALLAEVENPKNGLLRKLRLLVLGRGRNADRLLGLLARPTQGIMDAKAWISDGPGNMMLAISGKPGPDSQAAPPEVQETVEDVRELAGSAGVSNSIVLTAIFGNGSERTKAIRVVQSIIKGAYFEPKKKLERQIAETRYTARKLGNILRDERRLEALRTHSETA